MSDGPVERRADGERVHHSKGLVEKLQRRHLDTVSSFQREVREMSASIDQDEFNVLAELRTKLMASRTASEEMIQGETERLLLHKKVISESDNAFQAREVGAEETPFVDCIHQDGLESVATRRERIAARLTEVLEVGAKIHAGHAERVGMITGSEDWLRDCEAKRKAKINSSIEKLLGDLTTIAYTDVTGSQLLVQRAAVSVNEQLLQNQMATATLISQLRQHELLKQRENSQRVAALYAECQQVLLSSVAAWTQQYLCCPKFRAPSSRIVLLMRVGEHYTTTKHELSQALEGIGRLTESLEKREESWPTEQPGGTQQEGWLRTFCPLDNENPFPVSPIVVAQETKVAVEVILHHCQCKNATFLAHCDKIGRELENDVKDTIEVLNLDIGFIFTPSEKEYQLIREISLSPTDVYPFHTITSDPEAAKAAQERNVAAFTAIRNAISTEVRWFLEAMAYNLFAQHQRLVQKFITGSGSVIGTLWDATLLLEQYSGPLLTMVRDFYAKQAALQRDYEDRLRSFEEEYQMAEYDLIHAGNVRSATLLCSKAMKLLDAIEEAHCENHITRTDLMPVIQEELDGRAKELGHEVRVALGVLPVSYIEEHNAHVDQDAAEREERRIAAGNKKDLLKELAALPPLPEKMELDLSRCITVPDGTQYVLSENMKIGTKDEPQPTAPREVPQAPSPKESKKEKDEPSAKKEKNKKAVGGPSEAELEATRRSITPVVTSQMVFEQRNQASINEVFFYESLVVDSHIEKLFNRLRNALLSWSSAVHRNCMRSVVSFNSITKEQLDERSNHLIRHHQRRAPTLQAQLYETRVRELEDNSKGRAKYVAWLHQRISSARAHAVAAIEAAERRAEEDLDHLGAVRKAMVGILSLSALDTHKRAFAERAKKASAGMSKESGVIRKQLDYALNAILHEITVYSAERVKSYDEGGDMAPDEFRQLKQQLDDIKAEDQKAGVEMKEAIQKSESSLLNNLDEEQQLYLEAHVRNVAELKFFGQMQEQFAAAKAKITNQLSTSSVAEITLAETIGQLEEAVAKTSGKRLLASNAQLAVDYEAAGRMSDAKVEIEANWDGDDIALSNCLRQCRLHVEQLLRSSRPLALLQLLDDLRRQLYVRGLALGCLQYGVDYQLIPPDSYLEPRGAADAARAAENGQPQSPLQPKEPAGKKPPAGKGKEKPKSAEGERPDNAYAFLKVLRMESQAQRWLYPMRDRLQQTAAEYFKEHPPPLMRTDILGGDLPAVTTTIQTRIADQESRTTQHVVAAIKVYREHVQRVHLAIHRFAHELFTSLFNVTTEMLDARLAEAFRVFGVFETALLEAKRNNNKVVKASMGAPSNRGKLETLAGRELQRQKKNIELLQKYRGILLREIQQECHVLASRGSHTLDSFYTIARAFVTPEHLIPGDEIIVGRHRGLKRLMRQRMKEEMAKQLEGATLVEQGKGKDKKDSKKEAPKKKDDKGKGKGAKDKEEEEAPLPVLEKPLFEIPGITLNAVKLFEDFKKHYPSVALKNHYVPPSQWEQETARVSEAPPPETGKKGAAKAKAPQAQGKSAPATESVPAEVPPLVGPTLTAPKEKLFQQAALIRQQTVDNFSVVCTQFSDTTNEKLRHLETAETLWIESWSDAIASLRSTKGNTQ